MRIEELGRQRIARTGWMTDARCCPLHGGGLELTFDETEYAAGPASFPVVAGAHDDNRVRWRCEACVGSYTENFFLRGPGFSPPSAGRLILPCPRCGSRRVYHECVPACCEQHACVDCGGTYNARVELLERGRPDPRDSADELGALHADGRDARMSVPGVPAYRSGFTRSFRCCPDKAGHGPLELVFLVQFAESLPSDPKLLAWYCAACKRSWTEACFHHHEIGFIPDAEPGAVCPECGSSQLESPLKGGPDARCTECGARIRVHLEPRR